MKSPLLSVIVANYNSEKYLRDCLESILKQNFRDLEICICDDSSSDDSLAILKEYKNRYPSIINIVSNTSNLGVAQTRHLAILQAKGEYLTTLDSDDYYYSTEKLQREMDLILSHKGRSGNDIVAFSNIVLVKGDGSLIAILGDSEIIKEGSVLKEIISRTCMIPRDFIVKKDVYFKVGGYDASIPIYEDWDLKIRLANICDFYYSGANGTAYRRHGDGMSSVHSLEHKRWTQRVFDKNIFLVGSNEQERVSEQFYQFILKLRG